MASDLIERLRAKDANWQELCNRWEAQAKENGAKDDELVAGFRTMRKTIEAESADELATLRTALAVERERAEKAERKVQAFRDGGLVQAAIARQGALQDERDDAVARAESAEASLAEAKRLLKPFDDVSRIISQRHLDGHIDDLDTVPVVMAHIRAAARFLAQEEGRPSPKGGPDHG